MLLSQEILVHFLLLLSKQVHDCMENKLEVVQKDHCQLIDAKD